MTDIQLVFTAGCLASFAFGALFHRWWAGEEREPWA